MKHQKHILDCTIPHSAIVVFLFAGSVPPFSCGLNCTRTMRYVRLVDRREVRVDSSTPKKPRAEKGASCWISEIRFRSVIFSLRLPRSSRGLKYAYKE